MNVLAQLNYEVYSCWTQRPSTLTAPGNFISCSLYHEMSQITPPLITHCPKGTYKSFVMLSHGCQQCVTSFLFWTIQVFRFVGLRYVRPYVETRVVTDVSRVSGSENSCQRWSGVSTLTCWKEGQGWLFFYLFTARRMISPVALISMDPLVQLWEGWWISAERLIVQWRYFNND